MKIKKLIGKLFGILVITLMISSVFVSAVNVQFNKKTNSIKKDKDYESNIDISQLLQSNKGLDEQGDAFRFRDTIVPFYTNNKVDDSENFYKSSITEIKGYKNQLFIDKTFGNYNALDAHNKKINLDNKDAGQLRGWSIETVDSSGAVGEYTSIELDSAGKPHISYYDESNTNLKYAKWTGSSWSKETVDSSGAVGEYTSLALDSNDNPHISYYDGSNKDLKYAKKTGSSWSKETVDSSGAVGDFTSIALDSNDNPHISYHDDNNGYLKYAKKTGSSWSKETVDSSGAAGQDTSIALDSNNRPHISYCEYYNADLKYAKWTGSSWSIETVDSNGWVGWDSSIALDSNDNPHISYYHWSGTKLRYAKKTGSSWSRETVDLDGAVGWFTCIALDSNDNPHISYSDNDNANLKYAKKTGSSWSKETVDSNGDVGRYTSIELDSNNRPLISYYDASNTNLKYAKLYPPDLTVTDIWTEPETIYRGEQIDLCAKIKNIGSGDCDNSFYVYMYFDGSLILQETINGLDKGDTKNVCYYDYTWPYDLNWHTIKIEVDPTGLIPEENEGNNDLDDDFKAGNKKPNKPSKPSGTTSGQANQEYTYTASTTDPEGDQICYKFDWGDNSQTKWLGPYNSGYTISANHIWYCGGDSFDVKVKAKDIYGDESDWSNELEVTITNNPPYPPSKPSGPTDGYHGFEYCYSTSATDEDNHKVYIKIDWGDGTNSGWLGPYNSGYSMQKCHTWDEPGTFEIKAIAKDECSNTESGWSDILSVTMQNLPPNTPCNPNPYDGETWVETDVTLSWDGGDPNGDTVYYDIYLGTVNPPTLYVSHLTSTQYTITDYLEELKTYYWQIVAEDQYGEISYGPIWSFNTREYNPPILTNYNGWPKGHIPDEKICQSAQFTFCVHYEDVDGDDPIEKKLVISNGKEFNMELFQGDPDDGDYQVVVEGSQIGGGKYTYYFWYEDIRHGVRFPEPGEEWSIEINHKPNKPTIQGPQSGVPKKQYTFSALASDTEGDYLKYKFDWGDGTESDWLPHDHWLGPGEPVKCNHSWNSMKSYVVKVKAMDEGCNDESQWSDGHNIQIPKNKAKKSIYLISLIEKIIQKFPLLKKIIKMIALK